VEFVPIGDNAVAGLVSEIAQDIPVLFGVSEGVAFLDMVNICPRISMKSVLITAIDCGLRTFMRIAGLW
jgi:acyl-[acyl carrier protein]--UDP-N-acetylglucosamine O-acyltransferase